MKASRRGRINDLLAEGKSQQQILVVLDREFPPGKFETSNLQAIKGTQRDLGINKESGGPAAARQKVQQAPPSAMDRADLVASLRSFDLEPVVRIYREKDLQGKTPTEIVDFSVDRTIYRAFHHESPSQRYRAWRWHRDAEGLLDRLLALESQEQFDRVMIEVGESLVEDWGSANELGDPSRMNIGVALKITNLVFKHLTFSQVDRESERISWLHVPWDSFTLAPLAALWRGTPSMPRQPGQGFVTNLGTYHQLHALISEIAQEADVPRIGYEFWAWDRAHQP